MDDQQVEKGAYQENYRVDYLPAGIYFLQLETTQEKTTKKLVVINH